MPSGSALSISGVSLLLKLPLFLNCPFLVGVSPVFGKVDCPFVVDMGTDDCPFSVDDWNGRAACLKLNFLDFRTRSRMCL